MQRSDIAYAIRKISNVTSDTVLENRSIQIALDRTYQHFDWPYYLQWGAIRTVATYTTGTAIVTNGSTTVTGVGTTWTSAMVGRKFRHADEAAYYRIASVTNTTTLVLEQAYQGDTDSTGSSYTIYKDEYRLAPDMDKNRTAIQLQNRMPITDVPPGDFDKAIPSPQSYSDPVIQVLSGTKLDVYSTGTVTCSGTTITGVGTSWLSVDGLGRMSRIIVGSNAYTVKSVNSDTSITTYETLASVAVATTYQIELRNLIVQLYQIPDASRIIYYRYYRIPDLLVNDYDNPDMPTHWDWILVYGGLSMMLLQKGDVTKGQQTAEAMFLNGLEMMKLKVGSFVANRIYKKKSIDKYGGNVNDGLERSSFDRRYSSI